jgi:hypothetical protein
MSPLARSISRLTSLARGLSSVWCMMVAASCQSVGSENVPAAPMMTVVDAQGATEFRASVAYVMRPATDDKPPQWVVSMPGYGELLVDQELSRCRLVRASAVMDVRIWQATPCAVQQRGDNGRLCFLQQQMTNKDDGPLRVDGCADRNDLLLAGIEDRGALGIGPRAHSERCASINVDNLSYLRLQSLVVDGNSTPLQGARFHHDGDGFQLCFLSPLQRAHNTYRAEVWIEGPGQSLTMVVLAGDVFEL